MIIDCEVAEKLIAGMGWNLYIFYWN